MSMPAELAELNYGRELDERFDEQAAIDKEIARIEAERLRLYGHITGAVDSYFAEIAIDGCRDAKRLVTVIYELANKGVDLRESETFREMLEGAITESLGL